MKSIVSVNDYKHKLVLKEGLETITDVETPSEIPYTRQ